MTVAIELDTIVWEHFLRSIIYICTWSICRKRCTWKMRWVLNLTILNIWNFIIWIEKRFFQKTKNVEQRKLTKFLFSTLNRTSHLFPTAFTQWTIQCLHFVYRFFNGLTKESLLVKWQKLLNIFSWNRFHTAYSGHLAHIPIKI